MNQQVRFVAWNEDGGRISEVVRECWAKRVGCGTGSTELYDVTLDGRSYDGVWSGDARDIVEVYLKPSDHRDPMYAECVRVQAEQFARREKAFGR